MLETVSGVISQLDVLASFASVSSNNNYVRPKMGGDKVYLIESRHPLIEMMDPMSCISNDCRMVRDQSNL